MKRGWGRGEQREWSPWSKKRGKKIEREEVLFGKGENEGDSHLQNWVLVNVHLSVWARASTYYTGVCVFVCIALMCMKCLGTRRKLSVRCPILLGYATDPRPVTLLTGPVRSNSSEFLTPSSLISNSATELTAWPQQCSNHITWMHRSHYPALDPMELESHSNFTAGKGNVWTWDYILMATWHLSKSPNSILSWEPFFGIHFMLPWLACLVFFYFIMVTV